MKTPSETVSRELKITKEIASKFHVSKRVVHVSIIQKFYTVPENNAAIEARTKNPIKNPVIEQNARVK